MAHVLYIFWPDGYDSEIPLGVGVFAERIRAIKAAEQFVKEGGDDIHYIVFPLPIGEIRSPILKHRDKGRVWDESVWDPKE